MVSTNPTCFHLSASCIAAFKACPQRFRLAYREGLRKVEDTEAQRVGTNWHALHEVYRNALTQEPDTDWALEVAVQHLNNAYEVVPPSIEPEDWARERQILLMSFLAYLWYYQDDEIEYLHQEYSFELPVYTARTGLPLPVREVVRRGKIDHFVRWDGMVGPIERKSTTRNIEPGSDYWNRSKKDTQVSMYAAALRDSDSPEFRAKYGIAEDERLGNTLYDVWRRPGIKPKMLSQKDTATLLEMDEPSYYDQEFRIRVDEDDPKFILVDDARAEVEIGKSGKPALRETIEMFGARLLHDMMETPEKFFQRKEIARTDKDLKRFRQELYNIYQSQRLMDKTGCWYENEQQCRATFPCPFIPICYGPGADAVCDGETTPDGFKRIFTDDPISDEE